MSDKPKIFLSIFIKSIISGILVGIFILCMSSLTQLIWQTLPNFLHFNHSSYILIICLVGGSILAFLQKYAYGYPKTIRQLSQEKDLGETFKSDFVKIFITSLVVLSFGGSVGPEAPLAGLLVALFQWIKKDLNHLTFKKISSNKILNSIRSHLRITKLCSLFAALLAFVATYNYFNHKPSSDLIGLFRHLTLTWHSNILYLIPIGLIVGLLFGIYFNLTSQLSKKLVDKIHIPIAYQPILGGLILGLVGMYSLNLMFSGSNQLVNVTHHLGQYSLLTLIIFALGKPILTNVGFNLGWRGGPIFPAIFSSYLFAFAIMSLFQFESPIFALTVSLAATVSVTGMPLIMVCVYMLLYPIGLAPLMLIIAYLSHYLISLYKKSQKAQH